jgi:hypothetical protein
MKLRRLTLLLTLYVSLDLANPWMPGAFRFNPDESVEGVRAQDPTTRPQFGPVATHRPLRADSETGSRPTVRRPDFRASRQWFVDLRQGHSPPADPPSTTEDH